MADKLMITKKLSTGKCKLIFVAKINLQGLIHCLWKKLCKVCTSIEQCGKVVHSFGLICVKVGEKSAKKRKTDKIFDIEPFQRYNDEAYVYGFARYATKIIKRNKNLKTGAL